MRAWPGARTSAPEPEPCSAGIITVSLQITRQAHHSKESDILTRLGKGWSVRQLLENKIEALVIKPLLSTPTPSTYLESFIKNPIFVNIRIPQFVCFPVSQKAHAIYVSV